ncbi:FAD/FMN-containing dehydrogenase [Actinomycetospora succinea]|uniref:FAD/FMN-containing dehydrogenase n=1 Tax=Actinomycetospora succinea TaxID=663603 RepID=A0A4R6V3B5_9PSEU|nr:FAD-binding oxidoreductase [Actinomycetospora succinea]TDQ52639.1 FAD/FMN-containing dehydrogenase [Actinomycetospora succinea]
MTITPDRTLVAALRAEITGDVIDRTDHRYEEARRVWNGLIDRHPLVIARCRDVTDVVAALAVARRHRPVVSIRGGGHQVAGSAVCDDGLVIDLSGMTEVTVDAAARTARVGAGARWSDVNAATQRHGLVVAGGEVSETGVAGLTLGGGIGALQRAYGLSCDALRAVEIVTADGVARTASATEHADLFWAVRGGGRGIGVVTTMEFALRPLGPQVASALVLYPYDQAAAVLDAWRDLVPRMPDTVSPEYAIWSVPPDPAIPAEMHGMPVIAVAGLYAGPADEGLAVLAPLARLGTPLMDATAITDYTASQSALDPLFPAGNRYFFKSHFLEELTDAAAEAVVACGEGRPTPQCIAVVRTLGGAVAAVGDDETAFAHRRARFNVSIDAGWSDPADDDAAIGWARRAWDRLTPSATGGVYVNFAGLDEDADRDAVFGAHTARLDAIARTYDPDGVLTAAATRH